MVRIVKWFSALLFLYSLLSDVCLNAQYAWFGRNKVQYNDFDWHTLSTPHFKVYFYPEMKELAEIGAAYLEESYKIHQQNFNYSLVDTVPVIFYSTPTHFRETNTTPGLIPDGVGGFFEFIKGRVVIPFDGSLGNFKHVIRHELCHVFTMAKVGNVLKMHRMSSDRQLPLWFTEGLAEYWSTEWDATAEMIIKDGILNKYLDGLSNWEKFYGTFFMYKMGQNILEFIGEEYGEEKILLLMENFWMSDDFSVVMQKTIGKDYEAFDRVWMPHLKEKYFALKSEEDNPSITTRPVYTEGFGHKPTYYKNGNTEEIYFIANRTGYTSLYKVNLKKRGDIITVITGEKSEDFEEFHYFRTGLDISSKGVLAFATKRGGTDALHLYDVKAEKIIKSYHFDNLVQIGSPSFSSDGNKIVFPALDMSGKSDLFIFDKEQNKLTRLTNDYYDDRDPDISPDDKTIVFSSDRTSYGYYNKYNLFIYSLEDNTISYLTSGDQVDFSPQFSSDGKQIIYTSTIGGIQNIWSTTVSKGATFEGKGESVQITDNKIKKLSNFTTSAFDPKWAGDKIVFATYENAKISVRLLDSVSKLIDTPKTAELLNFDNTKDLWTYSKIKSEPKKNEKKYQKEYSLDIASTNISADPVFGATAGGILAMSDLLGNDQFYFLIFNNSETGEEFFKSFNIAVSRVSLGQRMNYAYGIYHLSGRRWDYGDAFSYFERNFGGYFALSYPLSAFRRIDASISLSNSKRSLTDERVNRRALLLTNSVSYTKDNSIWGPTGPLDGNRLSITLGFTTDIQFGNVNYYTIIFDYRRYLRLTNSMAFATRFAYLMTDGEEARRWAIGGTWDLRGWPRLGIRGRRAFILSNEFRFPIFNVVSLKMPLGLNAIIPYLRGAAFIDFGGAWDIQYKETLGAVGLGVRANLLFVLALRYDFGKRIENNLGGFQKGWFHQFYFGWDF